jgi:HYR domain/Secretion system C-terminal sorting domain
MRSIPIGSPNFSSDIVEILEDSEGKIVFCSNQQSNTLSFRNTYIMRFDPVGDTLIWFKATGLSSPTSVSIAENGPGGNFFFSVYKLTNSVIRSEIWELNRNTGLVDNNTAVNRYTTTGTSTTQFQKIIVNQGNIYAAGASRVNNSGPYDAIFSKISILTDIPEWNRIVKADTTASLATDMAYHDMVLDTTSAVMLGNGFKDILNPSLGRYVYLSKHRLDGELMWMERYDIPMFAEDILAVPDGYIVFGKISDNQWGMFKTDKTGQLLRAKTITTSALTVPLTPNKVRQGQLIRVADQLLMTDFFDNNGRSSAMLVKTDLNIGIPDSCRFVREVAVSQITIPARTILLPMSKETQNIGTGDAGVIYEKDAITVCGMCPLSPCCAPDITAKAMDSVFCSSGTARFGLRLCNVGLEASTQPINVSIYNSNPFTTAATVLYTVEMSDTLDAGECGVPFDIDLTLLQNQKLYVLAGSNGDVQTPILPQNFPLNGGFLECNYANNLDSITLALPPLQKLNLGPDRNICIEQSVTLDAGPGYSFYQWQGGPATQSYTVKDQGVYILSVTDACGRTQFDTIRVNITPQPVRTQNFTLLPGESVVIKGITYKQTTTFIDTIPSISGFCDTIVTYHIRVDELHCAGNAEAFYQVNYKDQETTTGRVLLVASDGSIYTAGESIEPGKQPSWALTKSKPNGEILWYRTFKSDNKFFNLHLIEDSEGNLVGTLGQIEILSVDSITSKVFRYNPNTDQMLWMIDVRTEAARNFPKILAEKAPGSNYILCYSLFRIAQPNLHAYNSEYCELDRNSGQIIVGSVKQYGPHLRVLGGLVHQNKIIFNGLIGLDGVTSKSKDFMATIDLASGTVLEKNALINTVSFTPAGGPTALDGDGNIVTLMYSADRFVYLRKNTIDGTPLWIKGYTVANTILPYNYAASIAVLSDGYALLLNIPIQNGQKLSNVLIKTDKNGIVQWSKKFAVWNVQRLSGAQSMQVSGDNLYVTGTTEFTTPNGVSGLGALLLKVDKDGNAGDKCDVFEPIPILQADYSITVEPTTINLSNKNRDWVVNPDMKATSDDLDIYTLCSRCIKPCDTIRVTKNITFYPGDTVVIDGKPYTQSGTVIQSFLTPIGCDSIVTNILTLVITKVDITCPNDLTVTLPPNTSSTVVDYNLPKASTDCPDPKITLKVIQGPGVGGSFPIGVNTVCYEASNTCGAKDTCCFKVTVVNPETPCDFKTGPNCMRYELLSVKFDAKGQRRYRVRLSNTCTSPVQFVYIQSPNGVNAVAPAGGSVYTTTPAGRAYDVRNPNASPFASIRFKAQTGGLKGGASDIFEYTLPQQSAPTYILVAVRLENGEYYEAYLNTFNCPAQPYDGNKNRENEELTEQAQPLRSFSVFPNPTAGLLYVNFPAEMESSKSSERDEVKINNTKILITNMLGQVIFQNGYMQDGANAQQISIALAQELANGIYQLSVIWPDGKSRSERFVLKR